MTEQNLLPKGFKALIVEDSATQSLQLKESLEQKHFQVITADDGLAALEKLKGDKPDIIITDVEMPKMNGYELCKHVKSDIQFQNIPVIILTNLSDTMDVIKGLQCGADSFMTKPLDLDLLLSNINDVFQNKKLRHDQLPQQSVELFFGGKQHQVQVNQTQIIDLLLSTYSNAIHKNLELEQTYRKLTVVNQELEKKNVQLKKLNDEKNQFLGMAAHDLRNPLSVIGGYAKILDDKLKDQVKDDNVFRMLNNINQSSNFMLNLINSLLDISIIESGKVVLNLQQVNLSKLISEFLVFQQFFASKKDIKLNFNNSADNCLIHCDPDKIGQVINNLVSNAIKFSNPNSSVEIILENNPSEVAIKVIDQGAGIPPAEKENIFSPFVKGSVKSTAGEFGAGLGLAIVKKIVDSHNGNITVSSEQGSGSVFSFSLPKKTS